MSNNHERLLFLFGVSVSVRRICLEKCDALLDFSFSFPAIKLLLDAIFV